MASDYASLLLFLLPRHDDLYTVHSCITLLWCALSLMPPHTDTHVPRELSTTSAIDLDSRSHLFPQPPSSFRHCNHGTTFDRTTHTITLYSWYWRLWPSHATTKSGILYSTHDNNLTSVLPTVPDTLRDDAYDEFTPCWLTSIIGTLSTGEIRSLIWRSKWWYLPHSSTGPKVSNEG